MQYALGTHYYIFALWIWRFFLYFKTKQPFRFHLGEIRVVLPFFFFVLSRINKALVRAKCGFMSRFFNIIASFTSVLYPSLIYHNAIVWPFRIVQMWTLNTIQNHRKIVSISVTAVRRRVHDSVTIPLLHIEWAMTMNVYFEGSNSLRENHVYCESKINFS